MESESGAVPHFVVLSNRPNEGTLTVVRSQVMGGATVNFLPTAMPLLTAIWVWASHLVSFSIMPTSFAKDFTCAGARLVSTVQVTSPFYPGGNGDPGG